jgi:hypothetical protein
MKALGVGRVRCRQKSMAGLVRRGLSLGLGGVRFKAAEM